MNVYYGNIHAIKGVSLEVNKGEVVSLIGANGAGKTTTLQAISGLLPIKAGEITFNNNSILKQKAFKRTRLGIAQVPEGRRVFKGISVEDNLTLGGVSVNSTKEEDKIEMDKIYQLFPVLKERRKQEAGTLSGGEQQMLAMGRALMTRPQVLLLDEPSMGLSPLFVDKIFDTIALLKRQNNNSIS